MKQIEFKQLNLMGRFSIAIAATLASSCNSLFSPETFSGFTSKISMAPATGLSSSSGSTLIVVGDATGETAHQSDLLADSVGVNTHFNYTDTFYGSHEAAIIQLLKTSGIRHIRDGGPNQTQAYYDILNSLYLTSGIRTIGGIGIADATTLPGLITSFIANLPYAEGIESLNEYDASGVGSWASYLQTYQPLLYRAVKANPLTAQLPVIGPSMAQPVDTPSVGDLSSYMDIGNMHNYYAGHNPGSGGWGDDGYGSIPFVLASQEITSGTKPIWTTETGYYTGEAQAGQSPDDVNVKYMPRMLLEQFNAGIQRTYIYQFAAEGVDATAGDGSSAYGLVDANQNPKLQYTAVKNLISILSDKGAPFITGKLNYTLSGNTTSVHHSLFQKRNGKFYLAVWLELESFNVYTLQRDTVTPQNITLSFASVPSKVSQINFAADGSTSTSGVVLNGASYGFAVTDSLSIFEITK